jgi:hypothetical protein
MKCFVVVVSVVVDVVLASITSVVYRQQKLDKHKTVHNFQERKIDLHVRGTILD